MNNSTSIGAPHGLPVSPDKEAPVGDTTHERDPRDATEEDNDEDGETPSNSGAVLTGNIRDASADDGSEEDAEEAPEGSDAIVRDSESVQPPKSGAFNGSVHKPGSDALPQTGRA